jgi:hypothetical protein
MEYLHNTFAPRRDRRSSTLTQGAQSGTGQQEHSFIDSRKATTLQISLRQISITLTLEDFVSILRRMFFDHPVATETLECVIEKVLPSILDAPGLLNYRGPPKNLRKLEQTLLPLAQVPHLKERARTLVFARRMKKTSSSIQARIDRLQKSCIEVRSSSALRLVLSTTLRIGNYISRGKDLPEQDDGDSACGFAVDSLLRLRDFRQAQGQGNSSEHATTALHCVVLQLQREDSNILAQLKLELQSCLGGGSEQNPNANSSVILLQEEFACFMTELLAVKDFMKLDEEIDTDTCTSLERLMDEVDVLAEDLQSGVEDVLDVAIKLTQYYGEKPECSNEKQCFAAAEKFFATICTFVDQLEESWRDIEKTKSGPVVTVPQAATMPLMPGSWSYTSRQPVTSGEPASTPSSVPPMVPKKKCTTQ